MNSEPTTGTVICNVCKNEVQRGIFCKYCGAKLPQEESTTQNETTPQYESKPADNAQKKKTTAALGNGRSVTIRVKKDILQGETALVEPKDDLKPLYNKVKYNRDELSSAELKEVITDFKNRANYRVENRTGKYRVMVNAVNNGILVCNNKRKTVKQFDVGFRNNYRTVVEMDGETSLYVVGASIEKIAESEAVKQGTNVLEDTAMDSADTYIADVDSYDDGAEVGSFYLFDFIKNLFRKGNVGVIIWLMINTVLVTFLIGYLLCEFDEHFQYEYPWAAYLIGFAVYIVSVSIALSPIGEWILRLLTGCKEIKRQDYLDRLNPLFEEVYQKAKAKSPGLPEDIKFYMSKDEEPNAFATGRKTVCLTEGILNYSDDEIKAVLGHEFGHLAHKDTDAILVVQVGNLIVTGMFVVFRLIINIFTFFMHLCIAIISDDAADVVISAFTRVLIDFLLTTIMALWTKIGVLLCLSSSRKNEYEADEYSVSLGYGRKLCAILDKLDEDRKKLGKPTLWAMLNSSHPDTDKRIAHMQEIGVNYKK